MTIESASRRVAWTLLDHAADPPVEVGDLVSAEPGVMPVYRVVAVDGPFVRLQDERHADQELPLDRLRWRSAA